MSRPHATQLPSLTKPRPPVPGAQPRPSGRRTNMRDHLTRNPILFVPATHFPRPTFQSRATFWARPRLDGRMLGCSTSTIEETPTVTRPSIRMLAPFAPERIQIQPSRVQNAPPCATFWAVKSHDPSLTFPPASSLQPQAFLPLFRLRTRSTLPLCSGRTAGQWSVRPEQR